MKKIKLLLLITSFLLLITPTLAEEKESPYVTKWEPITEILENRVTFQHAEFFLSDHNVHPESYTLRIEMDNMVIEEGSYSPGDIIEVPYDNSAAHIVKFTLWAHYPDGQPYIEHQLGYKNVVTKKAFDWNWKYGAPTCEGLKITWPKDLLHDAIDVNIRVKNLKTGEIITENFREADGFELGVEHTFKIELEYFEYEWVQVHGTNYHWEGSVVCGVKPEIPEEPTPEPEVPEVPVVPEVPEPEVPEVPIPEVPETPEVEIPETPVPEVPEVPEVPVPETPETPVPTLPVTGSAVNWIGYLFMAIGLVIIGFKK